MKHFPSDKYNLAWFKLAECVARGEKERALGVYRLLSHSITDKAYALKLEGDLLLAFKDVLSADRYEAAFFSYCSQGRVQEAIAMGEYLFSIKNQSQNFLEQLLLMYKEAGNNKKFMHIGICLLGVLVDKANFQALEKIIVEYSGSMSVPEYVPLIKKTFLRYVQQADAPLQLGHKLLQVLLEAFSYSQDTHELHRFLVELETTNPTYYQLALDYLTK